jgi:hypothetical protein
MLQYQAKKPSVQRGERPDARFGSLADVAAALPNIRFTPESGY